MKKLLLTRLTFPVVLMLTACTTSAVPAKTVTVTASPASTQTPVNTGTPLPTASPTPAPTFIQSKSPTPLPTVDFEKTDYSHFFGAYPQMASSLNTPSTPGYKYWTPIVRELARELTIPECEDWKLVTIIDTGWEDIYAHYEDTIVENGWTVLSSTKDVTVAFNGKTFNRGELRYDVGGDKEKIILIMEPKPAEGNPYYVLFFYDER